MKVQQLTKKYKSHFCHVPEVTAEELLSYNKQPRRLREHQPLKVFPSCKYRLSDKDQKVFCWRQPHRWVENLLQRVCQIQVTHNLALIPAIFLRIQDDWIKEELQVLPSASSCMKYLWVYIKIYELEFKQTRAKEQPFPDLSAPQGWAIWQVHSHLLHTQKSHHYFISPEP